MNAILLLIAFLAGMVFRRLGYPPLLGFLLAGFVANEIGVGDVETIRPLADLGITLLLFTIGLKLNLRELAQIQVWGTASAHTLIAVVLTVPVILLAGYLFPVMQLENLSSAWVLAFALSFSSTVFAIKIIEERGESAALHADIAIGILIIQDIFAVCFLVLTADKAPGLWALGLLVLPFLRPVMIALLNRAGHGELLVLFGVAAAIAAYELFELVDLKGGLGALIFGVLLGRAEKASELYKSLVSLKDLFLIGFFLQIGFFGLPSLEMVLVALALSALIFLRPLIYYFLLVGFGLRARTAFVAGFALFNYSEFGLIVGAIAVSAGLLSPEWLTTLALVMAMSLFIATPFNTKVHRLYGRFSAILNRFERKERLEREKMPSLGDAEIVVLGMGRVGVGAYETLRERYGDVVVGIEENTERLKYLVEGGYRCVSGDASDSDFWLNADLVKRRMLLISLSSHRENLYVVDIAKRLNYSGTLAVISRYPDHRAELESLGCVTFNLYAGAGRGFAEHVLRQMDETGINGSGQAQRPVPTHR